MLDSTDPGQVRAALADRLAETAIVVSSKSGSTVETDSQRRVFEQAFSDAGIDPTSRIIIVTDPGSPLDESAREAGYRVFNADPNVGGRYSALTAFGLVPSGLAGVDIAEFLDEAETIELSLAIDSPENIGLVLGAAIAATAPLRDKLVIVDDGTHIVGFADWAEQLIAESTGKQGTGVLPVVLDNDAPELTADLRRRPGRPARRRRRRPDLQPQRTGEIRVSGSLGAQMLVWEYATAVAGRLLGINPFDQPDVESAKIAARGLLDAQPEPAPAAFVDDGIEVRGTPDVLGASSDLVSAIDVLLEELPANGYLSVQAYFDRVAHPELEGIRDQLAARARPARHVRLGSALPALHRPVPQGRPGHRRVPAGHRGAGGRPRDPGPSVHLRRAHRRAGGGRRQRARRPRPARADPHLTDPAANIATLFDAVG